jgi:hydrogenase-4 component B
MPLSLSLGLTMALLAVGLHAIVTSRRAGCTRRVYGVSLAVCSILLGMALAHLLCRRANHADLALGLPWLGAHFRLDALSAFFLIVVNLGGAVASLFALGYGQHEQAPERVLPFYPAFLAGMNLVLLADDAFTFLFVWEFMSLSSWALVMAHHREPANARAGYLYLVMACFGTLALLLAFGLLAGPNGGYDFAAIRAAR